MRKSQNSKVLKLPSRPISSSYKPSGRTVNLITNHFKIKLREINKIYTYHLKITPFIEADNRKLKNKIIESIRSKAQEYIGLFIISGFTVFSSQQPQGFDQSIEVIGDVDNIEYKCNFTLNKVYKVDQIYDEDIGKSSSAINFFNILIKYFLKELKYSEFGKIAKYYDMSRCQDVHGTDLTIYGGFSTSFNAYEKGLFLRIDVCHKVIRRESVLQMINSIYKSSSRDMSKSEIRDYVRSKLNNQIVLANYGNFKYWKVKDVLFDRNCEEFETDEQSKINLLDYYKSKYNLTITSKKQPLLMVELKKVQGKQQYAYLVPEFCMLTGIPQDFNEFQRKKLSDACKKSPQDRIRMIENLAAKINSDKKDFNGSQLQKQIGISIDERCHELKGFQMQPPIIRLGRDQEIDVQGNQNLSIKGAFYDTPRHPLKWALIHFKEFDYNGFTRNLFNWSKQFYIDIREPKRFDMGYSNARGIIDEIMYVIEDRIEGNYDIVVLVLPNPMRSQYGKIKHLCTVNKKILSQVVLERNLQKKFHSVCGNLLQQMAAKCGSIVWVPKPRCGYPPKTMIIGATCQKDKKKRKSLVTFISTRNEKFYKYYSRVQYQKQEDTIQNVQQLVKESVTAYYKTTGAVPENIIYLREGVQTSQISYFQDFEIMEILKAFKDISEEYSPSFCAVLVDKRVNQKFFSTEGNGGLRNPPYGTVINTDIVTKNYDFYMVAQNVGNGTCTPTHYNVVFDSTEFSQAQLQEILYSQCFNYMNWNGSIRVPAPLQYATKLSTFITASVGEETHKDLRKTLYYL